MTLRSRLSLVLLTGLASVWTSGCTLDKQEAPGLVGPSGYGLSVTMSATPDVLPRDGASVSIIQLVARDADGKPAGGLHFLISSTAGVLTENDVVTDSSGQKTFGFTAPPVTTDIKVVEIFATPVGTNFDNSVTRRSLSIRVIGPGFPKAGFTFTPETPGQFDLVTFDASTSVFEGVACGTACSYAWDFGDGTSGSGLFTSHRFGSQGVFRVSLVVTSPGGTTDTTSQTVSIGAAKPITPVITVSPTDPLIGETVIFDGRSSTTPDGSEIVSYEWDFGNGTTATGESASTVFVDSRTYTIRLTIRDAAGRKGTAVVTLKPALPEPPPTDTPPATP